MATITDPTLTQATNATGQTVYVGNPSINPQFTYPSQTSAPASEVTTLSSDNISSNVIPQAQKSLGAASNKGLSIGADGIARYADGSVAPTYTDMQGNVRYGYDNSLGSLSGQMVSAPVGATPNGQGGWTAGGQNYGAMPDFTGYTVQGQYYSGDPTQNALIGSILQQTDAATKAQIDSITAQYTGLVQQQKDINMRQEASISQSLLMGGSSRYAQISSAGIIASTMSNGLQKIQQLENQENSLIASAKAAQATSNMKTLSDAMDKAATARKEKMDEIQKLNDALQKHYNDLQAQKDQATKDQAIASEYSKGTIDPSQILTNLKSQGVNVTADDVGKALKNLIPSYVNDVVTQAAKAGASPEAISQYLSTGDSKGINSFLDNSEYGQYAREARAAGQVPVSPNTYFKKKWNFAASGGTTGGPGGTGSTSDAATIAKAIINGNQPPVTTGLYRNTAAVRAELEKQGYNLTKANQDWTATQKLLSTLNGAQQTRLREAVGQVDESLGLVKSLADQWNGGGFPILNAANIKLAKSGVYGANAQSLATRLDAEIADITSELGTVYKGGNSSTDESLKLAAQQLSSSWSKQTFDDAVSLARQNIQYRKNSLNLGTGGIQNSQYNPQSTGQSLMQDEQQAQQNVIDYGSNNPAAQSSIRQMIQDGRSYSDIKQILGI